MKMTTIPLVGLAAALTLAVLPVRADPPMMGEKVAEKMSDKAGEPMATHIAVTPDELVWGAPPPMLPPNIKMAVLEGDPKKPGPYTLRAVIPANTKILPHWHPGVEHVTVISGTFHMAGGEKFDDTKGKALPPGGFAVIPAHMPHYAWSGDGDVVIQIHGTGPFGMVYINPADDPSKMQKK